MGNALDSFNKKMKGIQDKFKKEMNEEIATIDETKSSKDKPAEKKKESKA